jgi:hypothetical protein
VIICSPVETSKLSRVANPLLFLNPFGPDLENILFCKLESILETIYLSHLSFVFGPAVCVGALAGQSENFHRWFYRYLCPKRPVELGYTAPRMEFQIPTIRLSQTRPETVTALRNASLSSGFFQLTDIESHIPGDLIRKMFKQMEMFFDLPDAAKQKVRLCGTIHLTTTHKEDSYVTSR